MKQLATLLFAAILGGLIALGLAHKSHNTRASVNPSPQPAVLTANYGMVGDSYPVDFVRAAKVATPAVVNITAVGQESLARDRRNPFSELFDFNFEDLFGNEFNIPRNGTGSGVIFSEDGYIVTNNHVVGFADDIKVVLNDKREFNARKIGTDPSSDLAVLKIEADNLDYLTFGNSDHLQVGEWVLAVGNPFGYLTSTVTAGIVSAKGRDIDIIKGEKTIEEFIQTDAAINPGNSGGALVTPEGELVGINTAIATPTGVYAGYSFAIPSNLARKIVYDIIENGNIERANLGIAGYDINDEIIEKENLTVDSGIYVAEVVSGSGAHFSGVLPGDIIYSANGRPVNNFDDIKKIMQFSKVGDTIKLGIIRGGERKTIAVKLRKRI